MERGRRIWLTNMIKWGLKGTQRIKMDIWTCLAMKKAENHRELCQQMLRQRRRKKRGGVKGNKQINPGGSRKKERRGTRIEELQTHLELQQEQCQMQRISSKYPLQADSQTILTTINLSHLVKGNIEMLARVDKNRYRSTANFNPKIRRQIMKKMEPFYHSRREIWQLLLKKINQSIRT